MAQKMVWNGLFIILNPNWTLDDANTKRLAKKCIVFIKSWNSHTKVERWILKSFIALEHGTVIKAFFALIYPSIFSSADLFSFLRKSSKCNKTVLNVQRERERAVINKLNFSKFSTLAKDSAIICQFLSLCNLTQTDQNIVARGSDMVPVDVEGNVLFL